MADNDFNKGPIPDEYSSLTALRELSLKSTQRDGPLPSYLAEYKRLILLDLDDNELNGAIPSFLGNMTTVVGLLLNRNQFTGQGVPPELAAMTNLQLLFLDRNNIQGDLASPLCSLPNLKNISASNSIFSADCQVPIATQSDATAAAVGEVSCPCCNICCADDDDTCHNNDIVATHDPIWERNYVRPNYIFGNDTVYN